MSDPQVADEQSIVAVLEAAAAARPDAVALVDGTVTRTTRTLRDEAFRAAEALIGAGLRPGVRVAALGVELSRMGDREPRRPCRGLHGRPIEHASDCARGCRHLLPAPVSPW